MAKTTFLVDTLDERVKKTSSNSIVVRNINNRISKYIEKNSEILFNIMPDKRLIFSDDDRQFIYDSYFTSPKEIKNILRQIPDIDNSWNIANDPFNYIMTLIVRQFTIKKDKKNIDMALTYLALSMYPSIHYNLFKFVNEDCMRYTINNVSYKFILKRTGSVFKALVHTATVNHEKYVKNLIKGTDVDIFKYFLSLRNRIKEFMINFMKEYIKNYNSKKYIAYESESNDEDNFRENDNQSYQISRVANKVSLYFVTHNVDRNLVRAAVATGTESANIEQIKNSINLIKREDINLITRLIHDIIQVFINEGNNTELLKSRKFIYSSLSIYNRSNTKDETVLEIKDILEKFLLRTNDVYVKTTRYATRNNLKKILFSYFILLIQKAC